MTILSRKRIRLLGDQSTRTGEKMKDILTASTPELWRGNDAQFEIAIGSNGSIIDDISNIASLTIEVKPAADRDGVALMTKTVEAGDLQALSQSDWDSKGTEYYHALAAFTAAETNIAISTDTASYWLVIGVITKDSPGRHITLQASTLLIVEDGTGTAGSPPTNIDNYYTKGESDARYVPKHEDQAWSRWANGRWYHYVTSTSLWYPEVAIIVDSVPQLTLGDGVANP